MSPKEQSLDHPEDAVPRTDRAIVLRLVSGLSRALLTSGVACNRIEAAVAVVCQRLNLPVQVFATPTSVMAALGEGDEQRISLVRAQPGELDIGRVDALHEIVSDLRQEAGSIREALRRLEALEAEPAPVTPATTVLAFSLMAPAAAAFFGGGWIELAVAALVGLQLGLLSVLSRHLPGLGSLFHPAAAFLAGITAWLGTAWMDPGSVYLVAIAGLIVLLPGLGLTVGMRELAAGHLVAGSGRLAGAAVIFLLLAFGLAAGAGLGSAAMTALGAVSAAGPVSVLPDWTLLSALFAATVAFIVLFRIPRAYTAWVLLACAVSLVSSRLGALWLGPVMGAGVGAIAVGLVSNAHARFADRPAVITQVPGIMLLVPGSIGFRSIASMLEHDVLGGVEAAFTAVLVATAIATGLLIANGLLKPRRVL